MINKNKILSNVKNKPYFTKNSFALYESGCLKIIKNPWHNIFVKLVKNAKEKIYLSSPFIKENIAKLIVDNKQSKVDCKILTKFTLPNIRGGGLDLTALKYFQDANFLQKNISNLHAKIFIFDNQAIVTSSNLTNGGLKNNLEYGILIKGNKEIEKDFLNYYNDKNYEFIKNKHILKVEDFIKSLPPISSKLKNKSLDENSIFFEDIKLIKNKLTKGNLKIVESIEEIGKEIFVAEDIYKFKTKFIGKTPENTIRRNLQELRDIGLLEFIKRGKYKKLWD